MISKKFKLLNIIFVLFILLTLTGCPDLNSFDINEDADSTNFEEYYCGYFSAFGDVTMLKQNINSKSTSKVSYDLCDSFFSYSTVNDMEWENDEYVVEYNEYLYMAIEVDDDISIDSLALYVRMEDNQDDTKNEGNLYVNMYIVDSLFTDAPTYDDDEVFKKDGDDYELDNLGKKIFKDFDFPKKDTAIATTTVSMTEGAWTSFTLDNFTIDSNAVDDFEISDGQYILLTFYNNSGYGKNDPDNALEKVSFQAMNLLIRKADEA